MARSTVLPSGSPDTVGASDFGFFGAHNFGIPSLHVPLSNASSAVLPPPSHGSGPGWFAIPFLYDSFIHYSTPVYPDAIQAKAPAPHCRLGLLGAESDGTRVVIAHEIDFALSRYLFL